LAEFSRDGQDRDKGGADYAAETWGRACRGSAAIRIHLLSLSVLIITLRSEGSMMRIDRKIEVSFSASAEDYIRRFMKVAEETMPNANLVPVIEWYISKKFTSKATGEVRTFGPGVDVGAIEQNKLTDEVIVPMGGLKVAIRLPEELQSADRLTFDYSDGSFVVADH
jgi:hypothetical protein